MIKNIANNPYYVVFILVFILSAIFAFITYRLHRQFVWAAERNNFNQRTNKEREWIISILFSICLELLIITFAVGIAFYMIEEKERKKRLIIQFSSADNAMAIQAGLEMSDEGWLDDGSLRDAYFSFSNIEGWNPNLFTKNLIEFKECNIDAEGSYFSNVNFSSSCLKGSNFQETYFHQANLSNSNLEQVNFQYANFGLSVLDLSDLEKANFYSARIHHTSFISANLKGADFSGADLKNSIFLDADLTGAIFNKETILPDGTTWSEDVDISIFTDPDHPKFWILGGDNKIIRADHHTLSPSGEWLFYPYEITVYSPWDSSVELVCYPVDK